MDVFTRNYIMRKGSTFSQEILLSDIYITLDPDSIYTVEGGMVLVADSTIKFSFSGTLSDSNTILTILMSSTQTSAITNLGNYDFAIDTTVAGVVQTIIEGSITVKEDVSKTT